MTPAENAKRLTPAQMRAVLRFKKTGRRASFGKGEPSWRMLDRLVSLGLLQKDRPDPDLPGMVYFALTDLGRSVAALLSDGEAAHD